MATIYVKGSFATLGPVEDGVVIANCKQTVTFHLRDSDCKPVNGVHAVFILTDFDSPETARDGFLISTASLVIDGEVSYTVNRETGFPGFPESYEHIGAFTGLIGCVTADGMVISEPFTIPAG